jgi:hypothetical protein
MINPSFMPVPQCDTATIGDFPRAVESRQWLLDQIMVAAARGGWRGWRLSSRA